ncbi:hypothetical protein [Dactylosporangium salmoneum]
MTWWRARLTTTVEVNLYRPVIPWYVTVAASGHDRLGLAVASTALTVATR